MKLSINVKCDSPLCKSSGEAEDPDTWLELAELKKVKSVSPPYAWLVAAVEVFGAGPRVEVLACSVECLGPAVQAALDREQAR